jgi:RNA polymerase sigma-70 factor (ECF subfamily)
MMPGHALPGLAHLNDDALVALARAKQPAAFEALIQRHNRRLYRMARGVVESDVEAEDVLQDAYVRAFSHLDQFRQESLFSTWLTRIVLNEALGRVRRRRKLVALSALDQANGGSQLLMFPTSPSASDPEVDAARLQLRSILERAIDDLPEAFRSVFVLRDVEEMSVEETAAVLNIPAATVRTRFFRARSLLREGLAQKIDLACEDAFSFAGARCDRIVANVLARIRGQERDS